MNNRHRLINKLYRKRASIMVKLLPSGVEMLVMSRFYQAQMAELIDVYNQLPKKFENYLKNLRNES